jgi:predicted ATPase
MAEGITRISLKGFKSLAEECSIEIRPLTILAGANSSGKSSIMQPLLLMKQTLDATYDPGALLINGPNVQFTLMDQFLSRYRNVISDNFIVGISVIDKHTLSGVFSRSPERESLFLVCHIIMRIR